MRLKISDFGGFFLTEAPVSRKTHQICEIAGFSAFLKA